MKPITLVVEDSYDMRPGDYIIVTSDTNFIHVSNIEKGLDEEDEILDKPKRTYKKRRKIVKRGRRNPKRPTAEEMELRKEKLLDLVIKYPNKDSFYYRKKMNLNGTRYNTALNRLLEDKLVVCTRAANGKINPWKPINPS